MWTGRWMFKPQCHDSLQQQKLISSPLKCMIFLNEANNPSINLTEMICICLNNLWLHGAHTEDMQCTVSTLSEAAVEMGLWCPLHWKNYLTVTMAHSNECKEMDSHCCVEGPKGKICFVFLKSFTASHVHYFTSLCGHSLACLGDLILSMCHLYIQHSSRLNPWG